MAPSIRFRYQLVLTIAIHPSITAVNINVRVNIRDGPCREDATDHALPTKSDQQGTGKGGIDSRRGHMNAGQHLAATHLLSARTIEYEVDQNMGLEHKIADFANGVPIRSSLWLGQADDDPILTLRSINTGCYYLELRSRLRVSI